MGETGGEAIRNPFLGTAFGHLASEKSSDEGQYTTILAAPRIAKWAKPLPYTPLDKKMLKPSVPIVFGNAQQTSG